MTDTSDTRNAQYRDSFPTAWHVVSRLTSESSPLLIDVGAHRGESIEAFRTLFPFGKVMAIEANPHLAQELSASYQGVHDISIRNAAVSKESGTTQFFLNQSTQTSSIYEVNRDSRDSIAIATGSADSLGEINRAISVDAITLDSLVKTEEIEQIDVLKIDVQGAEVDVLEGARNALRVTSVLKLEIALFDFYTHRSSFYAIEEFTRDADLSLYALPFTSQNPMNGRTDWLEAIYWREPS
jgi:FkbM family methyltransferase